MEWHPDEAGGANRKSPCPPEPGCCRFTDGVIESVGDDGTRLGEERFIEMAARLATIQDPDEYVDALLAIQHADTGRHSDDTAVLYLRWPTTENHQPVPT